MMASKLGLCLAIWTAASVCCSFALRIPYIRRYEPLSYDLDNLLGQHQRLKERSADDATTSLRLQFIAMHRSFDLELIPDTSIFHRELSVRSTSLGTLPSDHLVTSTFTGHDRNTPGSRVHGNLISGVFDGTVYTDNDIYYIEPAHRYARDTSHHSIVYRHSDIDHEALKGGRCGVSDDSRADSPSLAGYLERLGRSMLTPRYSAVPEGTEEGRRSNDKRQARNTERVRCDLNVTGDYLFYRQFTDGAGGTEIERVKVAQSILVSYVQGASEIYKTTDFDGNPNNVDNIQFGIRDLVIESKQIQDDFKQEFIGVERFLTLHSERRNFERTFCLHYRFTHRDFDGGVLGLAYVAKDGARGGICEPSLNTGIVTTLNYGQRVPAMVTVLTFAHEAGHNFGSEHDPETNLDCAPGGNRGNFIMYAFANDGRQENNDQFSSCSITTMQSFITSRGQIESDTPCFSTADDLCQNTLLDDGEDCDCGINYSEDTGLCRADSCCNGTSCRLAQSAVCSPDQGDCCNATTCHFKDNSIMCANETDCGLSSFCNGSSASCPARQAKLPPMDQDHLFCNNNTATCLGNECTGSICVVFNGTDCQCDIPGEECHLCCDIPGQENCLSTIAIAMNNSSLAVRLPGGMGQLAPIGTPCNNFRGYCDFLNNCFQVDSEGALDRLTNLFSAGNVNQVLKFVTEKWWAVLAAAVGVLIGVFVLILVVHLLLPRPEHVKARAQRRQTIRRNRGSVSGRGGAHVSDGYGQRGHQEMRVRH